MNLNLSKEELIFYKHLIESAESAYYNEVRIYTDFLGLNEAGIFHMALSEMPDIAYSFWGGNQDAERVIICLHGDMASKKIEIKDLDLIKPELYPISCIAVKPLDYKFSEPLTHRDYLGAVLNLGLSRSRLGDILIKDKDACLFCDSLMEGIITEELVKVRHTSVKASVVRPDDLVFEKQYEAISGSVSSVRLDSVIKTAFHSSRTGILPYISGGKVLVNGRETLSGSYAVKDGDIISVRGLGKFKFEGQYGTTKKGKINIKILKYI